MISGASSEELDLANARADIILALDNTATYESWLYIDNYIEQLEKENEELKEHLIVPENITLKTLDDYKDYYSDATKDYILNDTYIEYCAYLNTIHILTEFEKWLEEEIKKDTYSLYEYNLKQGKKQCLDKLQELKEVK